MDFEGFCKYKMKINKYIERKSIETKTIFSSSTWKYNLEDFELIEILGKGAFGKVYKCKLKENNKIYAIK